MLVVIIHSYCIEDLYTTHLLSRQVDDIVRFVSQKSEDKEGIKSSPSNEVDKEESNEPDYDEGSVRRRTGAGDRRNNN